MVGEFLSLGDERARAHQAAAADLRSIENDSAHADERPGADRAAVQDRIVPDRAILPDIHGKAHVGMQHRILLNVGAGAEENPLVVAAQRRAEPDAAVVAQHYVADDVGVGRDPESVRRRQRRPAVIEGVVGHCGWLPGKGFAYSATALRRLSRAIWPANLTWPAPAG